MLDWFAGAVESAKAVKEIGQSLLTIRDENIIRDRVYELNNNLLDLQQKLLEAQMNQMDLVQRIKTLEGEKEQSNQAVNLKEQYSLHTFPTAAHAYVLKTEQGEPRHFYCTHCLETANLVVTLQGAGLLTCPKCKYSVRSTPRKPIQVARY